VKPDRRIVARLSEKFCYFSLFSGIYLKLLSVIWGRLSEIMPNWNNLRNFPYNVLGLLKEFVGGVSSQ